jgi:hypothetical protein
MRVHGIIGSLLLLLGGSFDAARAQDAVGADASVNVTLIQPTRIVMYRLDDADRVPESVIAGLPIGIRNTRASMILLERGANRLEHLATQGSNLQVHVSVAEDGAPHGSVGRSTNVNASVFDARSDGGSVSNRVIEQSGSRGELRFAIAAMIPDAGEAFAGAYDCQFSVTITFD